MLRELTASTERTTVSALVHSAHGQLERDKRRSVCEWRPGYQPPFTLDCSVAWAPPIDAPQQRRRQAAREAPPPLRAPRLGRAIGNTPVLPLGWVERVRLKLRLDHVDGVDPGVSSASEPTTSLASCKWVAGRLTWPRERSRRRHRTSLPTGARSRPASRR